MTRREKDELFRAMRYHTFRFREPRENPKFNVVNDDLLKRKRQYYFKQRRRRMKPEIVKAIRNIHQDRLNK